MATSLLTPAHLLILLAVLLLLFGAKRLPETGRALGQGMREFKHAITGHNDDSPPSQSPGLTGPAATHDETASAATEPSPSARPQ